MTYYQFVENSSLWNENETMPHFSSLEEDKEVDVCVVGGGIAGITTAYLLREEGKKVCILERYYGLKGSRLAAESHREAINKVKEIIKWEGIDCEMKILNGYLFAADDQRKNILYKEFEACRRAGLADVVLLDQSPLPFFQSNPCLRFSNQLKLHPLKYLKGMVRAFTNLGGEVYTNTHVVGIRGGEAAEVKTKNGFTVRCQSIVMATNSPINDRVVIHTKQAAYRSYVVGLQIPKNSIRDALYWDTLDPYHYLRVESLNETQDLLIVGGADHKTGQDANPESHFETLGKWVRHYFPMSQQLVYKWSGQVMEPIDGLAFLGRNPMDKDNVYVITGDSGNGMTHCTIGAMLVTDQIMNRKNPWEDLYNPSRISFRASSKYLKENTNVASQYTDWLRTKAALDFDSLEPGEGVIYRQG